ncbi:MAG: ribonuclease H-like domain-containing protein, partial [Synergistaceae bacterium]|nr:ribonuclease H-like domain-containing protein [Synergistaceae bacterium]
YETQWLEAVDAGISTDTTLVTYNGSTFDLPMLHTRHIMSRLRPPWKSSPHIDLLHLSRRLYRGYLKSCSLGSVERHILGMQRNGEDVPGSMIPSLYRQFLYTLDASGLGGVFYHNRLDIASLASLYCHIAGALDGSSSDGREHLRAGDIWNDRGQPELALYLWNMAASDPSSRAEAIIRRAYFAKKNKDHASAKEHFTNALDEIKSLPRIKDAPFSAIKILEELAKLEEHHFMSPESALRHVRSAIEQIRKSRFYGGRYDAKMSAAMERRRIRLEKKIRGTSTTKSDEV